MHIDLIKVINSDDWKRDTPNVSKTNMWVTNGYFLRLGIFAISCVRKLNSSFQFLHLHFTLRLMHTFNFCIFHSTNNGQPRKIRGRGNPLHLNKLESLPQGWFVPSLIEIGPVVLEKKSKMCYREYFNWIVIGNMILGFVIGIFFFWFVIGNLSYQVRYKEYFTWNVIGNIVTWFVIGNIVTRFVIRNILPGTL
jgi:hypothetical protein